MDFTEDGWRRRLMREFFSKQLMAEEEIILRDYKELERTKRRVRDALPVWGTDLVMPVLKAEGYDERLVAMVLSEIDLPPPEYRKLVQNAWVQDG